MQMCLSVGLSAAISCAQNISKTYERILMKFCGKAGHDEGSNRLDFGGDPGSFMDPGSFSRNFPEFYTIDS